MEPAPAPPESYSTEDLGRMIAHLQDSVESDKVALARQLHDDLGGLLVAAVMDIGWVERHLDLGEDVRAKLARVRQSLAAAIDLKRTAIEALRPTLLDNFGLFAAFRWHMKHSCERAGIVGLERYPEAELQLTPTALTGLFRIFEETLAVILSEHLLKSVDVHIDVTGGELLLRIDHAHDAPESVDMFCDSMERMGCVRHRIAGLDGRVAMQRSANGTLITANFPLASVLA